MSRPQHGSVYLVCFDGVLGDLANPKGSARHYLGWADDISARMTEHRAGRGARILAACVNQGTAFDVARTRTDVDRNFEWRLKRQHKAWRLCPRCSPPGTRRQRAASPPACLVVASSEASPP